MTIEIKEISNTPNKPIAAIIKVPGRDSNLIN